METIEDCCAAFKRSCDDAVVHSFFANIKEVKENCLKNEMHLNAVRLNLFLISVLLIVVSCLLIFKRFGSDNNRYHFSKDTVFDSRTGTVYDIYDKKMIFSIKE